MRTYLRMVPVATAALVLAACATDGGYASKAAPAHSHSHARQVTDAEYVAYVERKALSRGVEVHWVHPPTKTVAASDE